VEDREEGRINAANAPRKKIATLFSPVRGQILSSSSRNSGSEIVHGGLIGDVTSSTRHQTQEAKSPEEEEISKKEDTIPHTKSTLHTPMSKRGRNSSPNGQTGAEPLYKRASVGSSTPQCSLMTINTPAKRGREKPAESPATNGSAESRDDDDDYLTWPPFI
jgi:hypothetical protein